MKKSILPLLLASMICLTCTGCGGDQDTVSNTSTGSRQNTLNVSSDLITESTPFGESSKTGSNVSDTVTNSGTDKTSSNKKSSSTNKISSNKKNSSTNKVSSNKKTSSKTVSSKAPPIDDSYKSVVIDLKSYFNKNSFSFDKNRGGGGVFDDHTTDGKTAYPADEFKSSITFNGLNCQFGPVDGKNTIQCSEQEIKLQTPVECEYIGILVAGVWGHQDAECTIKYTDGSKSTAYFLAVDWCIPTSEEEIAVAYTHRHHCPAGKGASDWVDQKWKSYVFYAQLEVDPGKKVSAIVASDNKHVNIFAATAAVKK